MLDFTSVQKKFLTIKLIDENTVFVRMPTKQVFDSLNELRESITLLTVNDMEAVEHIYDLMAVILSNNRNGKEITSEYIGKILDIEDITILFNNYMNFVNGITDSPNSESLQVPETVAATEY